MIFVDLFDHRSGYYVMQKEASDICIMPLFRKVSMAMGYRFVVLNDRFWRKCLGVS